MDTVKSFVLLNDEPVRPETTIRFAGEYEELLAKAGVEFEFQDFDENIRATTFYSTGTTGMPKGVYFSQRQLVLHTLGIMATLGATAGHGSFNCQDVYMPITPMFHVHAWGVPYIATMLGVKQVYPGRYVPDTLLELVEKEGVTFSHCVPTILHMLLKHPHAQRIDLSRWKLIIGGAAMSRTLCLDALSRGIDVFTGYGMSETCPILTIAHLTPEMLELSAEEQAAFRCKTGRSVPLVDLKIVDSSLREQPRDGKSVGEIVVRAPWLTQGYLKDVKASERLWEGGWLHTGDVAVKDPDGFLRIVDRKKDMIVSGGFNVFPSEVESVIAAHPAVAQVAVFGVPDEKWGEAVTAAVVLRPGAAADPEALIALVREHKGPVQAPKFVHFIDAIPQTSVGKPDKKALRRRFG
jgi:fatty-acyl-CoA synthase